MLFRTLLRRVIETSGCAARRIERCSQGRAALQARGCAPTAPGSSVPAPPAPSSATSLPANVAAYDEDGLRTIHNHEFANDPSFVRAYERGVAAAGGEDYRWRWRVHVGLWAASAAVRLPGDFVECGVNRGFLSSAIMTYLDWNARDKTFYLLDTFSGVDERYVSEAEKRAGALERAREEKARGFYVTDVESVRANFAEWRNVKIIQGSVPETLAQVGAAQVAYLHLDMNCSAPEVAAADFFWPRLVGGALILLDDYAYYGYRPQKIGMDDFARRRGVSVLSLPTGQGLIIKPPEGG